MFPVSKQDLLRYCTEGNKFTSMFQRIIDENTKRIVMECQQYQNHYALGEYPQYAADLDLLLCLLNNT